MNFWHSQPVVMECCSIRHEKEKLFGGTTSLNVTNTKASMYVVGLEKGLVNSSGRWLQAKNHINENITFDKRN